MKIYPQSYAAASYAVDLLNPAQVVGFPEGFPVAKEQWCSLSLEKLMHKKTTLVLLAPYTHPRLIQSLQTCQIPYVTLKHPTSFPEIAEQALEFCSSTHHLDLGIRLALTLDAFYASIQHYPKKAQIVLLQDHGRLGFMQDSMWNAFTELQVGNFSFEKILLLKPAAICIFSQLRTKDDLLKAYPVLKAFPQVVVINTPYYHYPSFWNREAVQAVKDLYENF